MKQHPCHASFNIEISPSMFPSAWESEWAWGRGTLWAYPAQPHPHWAGTLQYESRAPQRGVSNLMRGISSFWNPISGSIFGITFLSVFFLKKRPDGILIIFKTALKYQCLHTALCTGLGGCGTIPVTLCCHRPVWQHYHDPQHCSGDRQMWKWLTNANVLGRDCKGTSICFYL